ncbi:MAG: hypothetical protein AAGH41_07285 [Pseudomonadota bacterium]
MRNAVLWLAAAAFSSCTGLPNDQHEALLSIYIDVFDKNAVDGLPLAENVTFSGPLLAEPIVGRDQVAAFLSQVSPSVAVIEVRQSFEGPEGGCAELALRVGDRDVEEVHCVTFDDGAISAIRLYFDPRPLL